MARQDHRRKTIATQRTQIGQRLTSNDKPATALQTVEGSEIRIYDAAANFIMHNFIYTHIISARVPNAD